MTSNLQIKSRLEEMMDADAENVVNCRRLFRDFHPELEFLLDEIAELFLVLSEAIGSIGHGSEFEVLSGISQRLGITAKELIARMESKDKHVLIQEARGARNSYQAREVRILTLLACKRQFMWGAAEILKYKVTPAMGFLRQECESIGFLHMFRDRPELAVEWMTILTPDEGTRFYRRTQADLKKVLEGLQLLEAYNFGSATALHVRLASMVRGKPIVVRSTDKSSSVFSIPYHEIQPNPFRFLLSVLNWIRNQERVLHALTDAFRELDHSDLLKEIAVLQEVESELWRRLAQAFPMEVASIKRGAV